MMRRRKDLVSDIVDILLEPLRRARELAPPPAISERPMIEPIEPIEEMFEERPRRRVEMRQPAESESIPPASNVEYWEKFWSDIASSAVPGYEYLRSRDIWKYLR